MHAADLPPPLPANDGSDHPYRQTIANQYSISVLYKTRLNYCIIAHYALFFSMLIKLTPFFLDYFDIFILDIEELDVPKPLMWEFIWPVSLVVSFFGLDAIKRSNIPSLYRYMVGVIALGVLPLLYAAGYYFWDVWVYIFDEEYNYYRLFIMQYWRGYPYGLLWYGFIILALQVHVFSLFFSYKLILTWKTRGTRRAE